MFLHGDKWQTPVTIQRCLLVQDVVGLIDLPFVLKPDAVISSVSVGQKSVDDCRETKWTIVHVHTLIQNLRMNLKKMLKT